jgi:hypothetical protein
MNVIQAADTMPTRAFSAPPDLVDDSGAMIGWFIEPAGLLLQPAYPVRGTTQMAEWLVGPGFERLAQRFAGQRGLTIILDTREMTGRSASARALLIANATRVLPRVGRVVLLPSRHMGSAYLRVVEASASIVRAMGLRLDIEHDLDSTLAKHAVRLASSRASEATTTASLPV